MDGRARILAVVEKSLNVAPGSVTPASDLVAEFYLNSMIVLSIMVGLEREFGIYIPSEEFSEFGSVADIERLVARLVASGSSAPATLPSTPADPTPST